MGGFRALGSVLTAVIAGLLAVFGMLSDRPVPLPPARVVDAIVDTSDLALADESATSATVAPIGSDEVRRRGEAALGRLQYDWRSSLPGWELSFHPGRDGVLGYTFVHEKRIEVYVREAMTEGLLAHVIAHEIGHALDVTVNDSEDRRRWQDQRGIAAEPWWPGNGATDFATGAGDFAECFAAWQVGEGSFRSTLAPPPDPDDLALLADLLPG